MDIRLRNIIFLILFSILLFSFASCDNEDEINNPAGTPPEMPPVSSLIDFNEFPLSGSLGKISENSNFDEIATKANWGWASFNVIVWQTIVTTGMAIPVAAFAESFNHEAERQEDGRWLWTYDFTPFTGIKYTASLYADVSTTSVTWEMYISKEDEYTDFLWYTGESDLLATSGTWVIYAEPANPTEWIGIEWNRNPSENTADVKYTNIKPDDDENGGYIFFGITADEQYNAFYEIFNKGEDNLISVRWNRTSKAGSVMDTLHFGDSDWHCWDETREDIDCP